MTTTDATRCATCGGPFSRKRIIIDGTAYHESCSVMSYGPHTPDDMADMAKRLWRLHEAAEAFEGGLSSLCDGPERDALNAALAETYKAST